MQFSDLVQKLAPQASSLSEAPTCNPEILGMAAIDEASAGTLSYIEGPKFAAAIATTGASALILPMDESLQTEATNQGLAWLATPEPRLMFAQGIALFYQPFRPKAAIHPTAVIDPTAQIGTDVHIGAHVVIHAGVMVGNGACIHANVVIYPQVKIGDRTTLHANCVIHERSQIGADCVIHSGAAIGAEGFGFVPTAQGWVKMEQSGYTVLEDGVEIGCNAAVDRPAVGETRVGRGTKIDNLVHIAHGCKIGQGCAMAAQVGMAGGVTLGNGVILAGQVGIANQVKMGDRTMAASKSGIHSDVPPGEVVAGYPAVPHKLWLKVSAIYNRLPELYQTVRRLQRSNPSD